MTKENPLENVPNSEERLDKKFDILINGGLSEMIELIKMAKEEKAVADLEIFKSLVSYLKQKIEEMKKNPEKKYSSAKGTPLKTEDLEISLKQIEEVLKEEEVVDVSPEPTSKPSKTPAVVAKKKKTAKKTAEKEEKPVEVESEIKTELETKTEAKPENKPSTKPKTAKKTQVNSLENLGNNIKIEALSEYDKLIQDFITEASAENRNAFLAKRRSTLDAFISSMVSKGNIESEDSQKAIAGHMDSIKYLINKIQEKRLASGGEDGIINLLQKDIQTLENIDKVAEEAKILKYKSVEEDVEKLILELKEKGFKKTMANKAKKFIQKNKGPILQYIKHILAEGIDRGQGKKGGAILSQLRKDFKALDLLDGYLTAGEIPAEEKETPVISPTPANPATDTKPDTSKKEDAAETKTQEKETNPDNEYRKIDIIAELSKNPENIKFLSINHELKDKILAAAKTYNEKVESRASVEEIESSIQVIEDVKKEWIEYKKNTKKDMKKSRAAAATTTSTSTPEAPRTVPSTPESTPAPASTSETSPIPASTTSSPKSETSAEEVDDASSLPIEKMMYIDDIEKDYSHIQEDQLFNTWLNRIYNSLVEREENNEYEVRDIEDWYKKYQEAIPYYKKLETIFNDIEASESEKQKKFMSKDKINILLYEIYKGNATVKIEIQAIYQSYEFQQANKAQIVRLKEAGLLAKEINDKRSSAISTSRPIKLKTEEVKRLLESKGEDTLKENTEDLVEFLEDIQQNYDFYTGGNKEGGQGEILKMARRFNSNKKNRGEKISLGGGLVKKIRSWIPFTKKIEPTPEEVFDLQQLVKSLRKLNLVDRKDGNKTKKQQNNERMSDLIEFMRKPEYADNLHKIIDGSITEVELATYSEEDKTKIQNLTELYRLYTNKKYRDVDTITTAEEMLSHSYSADAASLESSTQSAAEVLFKYDDPRDLRYFEEKAEYECAHNEVKDVLTEIDRNSSKRNVNQEKIKELNTRFQNAKGIMESLGTEDEDDLVLKKVELKLIELTVKNIDRSKVETLTKSMGIYNKILDSENIELEAKKGYVRELITALKAHRVNKKNNVVQNSILDTLINKYEDTLRNIN